MTLSNLTLLTSSYQTSNSAEQPRTRRSQQESVNSFKSLMPKSPNLTSSTTSTSNSSKSWWQPINDRLTAKTSSLTLMLLLRTTLNLTPTNNQLRSARIKRLSLALLEWASFSHLSHSTSLTSHTKASNSFPTLFSSSIPSKSKNNYKRRSSKTMRELCKGSKLQRAKLISRNSLRKWELSLSAKWVSSKSSSRRSTGNRSQSGSKKELCVRTSRRKGYFWNRRTLTSLVCFTHPTTKPKRTARTSRAIATV